jgi:DNA-binding MarR family transcriptional regulator
VTRHRTAGGGPAGPDLAPLDQAALGGPALDLAGLDQAGRIWAVMRDLADNYPSKEALRAALNLGRGSGRVKALLCLLAGPLSLSELAEAVSVDAPYATLIVDNLEERSLVERRPDPADRRRKVVWLTPEGRQAAQRAQRVRREPPPGFARLSPAELELLEELMLRISGPQHAGEVPGHSKAAGSPAP